MSGLNLVQEISTTVVHYIEQQETFGPLLYTTFLAISITLLFPTTVTEIIAGYLFGAKIGFLVAYIGKTIGLIFSYSVGAFFKDKLTTHVFNKYPTFHALKQTLHSQGFSTLLMIRLSALPMVIKNHGLAALDVPFRSYVSSGVIAGLPTALLWSSIGSASHSLYDILHGEKRPSISSFVHDLIFTKSEEYNLESVAIIFFVVVGAVAYMIVLVSFAKKFREILSKVKKD